MAAKPGLGTLGEFPRLRLCRLPTPLEAMPNLGEALGGAGVYVKRDDCTDLAFGGQQGAPARVLPGRGPASGRRYDSDHGRRSVQLRPSRRRGRQQVGHGLPYSAGRKGPQG